MTYLDLYYELLEEYRRLYFGWARDLIKLSASGLALTVSLQSFFLKQHAHVLWMLAASWGCLVFAILFGLWALRGEVDLYYTAADSLGFVRSKTTNEQVIAQILQNEHLADLRPEYKRAYSAMTVFFVVGLLGFVLFGILNLP